MSEQKGRQAAESLFDKRQERFHKGGFSAEVQWQKKCEIIVSVVKYSIDVL